MVRICTVTPPRSQQRRIALQTARSVHDLALPGEEALGNALLALGLLPESREQILDPTGRVVGLDTRAEQLREGGLYSITAPARVGAETREHGSDVRLVLAPWIVLATALLALGAAVLMEARSSGHVSAIGLMGLAAASLVALLGWGRSARNAQYVWVPVLMLAGVVLTLMWRINPAQPTLALAAAMGAAAAAGAFIIAFSSSPQTRAMGGPITVISGVGALALLSASMLQWDLLQIGAVSGAIAGVGLRAVPYWIVKVDDGHHVDYARFIQVRWSVRGNMPEYLPHVDIGQVRARVRVLDTRLRVATAYLSVLVALGLGSVATFLSAPTRTQRIAAVAALVLMALGVVLNSRRTMAAALRTPPRLAVALGLIVAGVLAGTGLEALADSRGLIAIGVLLFAGTVAGGIALAISRGARSILWSRVGDIVEALSVALMVPAALVAVGTIDILRGVFSG